MNNLNLPRPKMMDIAVPANLACGRPQRLMRVARLDAPAHSAGRSKISSRCCWKYSAASRTALTTARLVMVAPVS